MSAEVMHFQKKDADNETFNKNVLMLRDIIHQGEQLKSAGKLDAESAKVLEIANGLLKIAEPFSAAKRSSYELSALLQGGYRPSEAKQVAVGASAMTVGTIAFTASTVFYPLTLTYEKLTGNEHTVTDSAKLFGEGARYLGMKQTKAWEQAVGAVAKIEDNVSAFQKSFNDLVFVAFGEDKTGIAQAQGITREKALASLTIAAGNLEKSYSEMVSIKRKYGAELEEMNGFFELSKEFCKSAAVNIAMTLATAKALEVVFHVAGPVIVAKVAESGAKVAKATETAVELGSDALLIATRAERAAVAIGRVEEAVHTGFRLEHVYGAAETEYRDAEHQGIENINYGSKLSK
jgi:hypothetical protein